MRISAMVLAAILALTGSALARDPATGLIDSFVHYQPPPLPYARNCKATVAELGVAATWYGRYDGNLRQPNDRARWFSAEACFASEAECRRWQHQAMNFANDAVVSTSCWLGAVPARLLR